MTFLECIYEVNKITNTFHEICPLSNKSYIGIILGSMTEFVVSRQYTWRNGEELRFGLDVDERVGKIKLKCIEVYR